jgi:hypothetical protein
MKTVNCIQGSAVWLAKRAGYVTASRVSDILGGPLTRGASKGGERAERRNYRWELVAETLTGDTTDHYFSWLMKEGREREPDSRLAYGMANGVLVQEFGLVIHSEMDYYRASPDGLINRDGAIELKNPKVTTHFKWMEAGIVPPEHIDQCDAVIDCCEREWCDFVSYIANKCKNEHCKANIPYGSANCEQCGYAVVNPIPEELQMFQVRRYRDDKRLAEMQEAARIFYAEKEDTIAKLRNRSIQSQLEASLEAL